MKTRNAAIAALSVGLVGCGDLAVDLGLGKQSPDEFQVVRRAPLSVPPNLALRPPRPGAVADNRTTSESRVREALFGAGGAVEGGPVMTLNFDSAGDATVSGGGFGVDGGQTSFGPSEGEQALLKRAGADRVSPSIRGVVDAESGERVAANEYLLDRILFWRDAGQGRQIVDARAESRRIRADASAGRATTGEGAATTTDSSGGRAGILDGIF